MPTIKPQFKLKDPKSEVPTSIYLRIYYSKKRFTYYLGLKILPAYWSFENQRPVLSNKEYPGSRLPDGVLTQNQDIDFQLGEYSVAVIKAFGRFTYDGVIPSTKQLSSALDRVFRSEEESVLSEYLIEYIDGFLKRTNNKPYTQRNYKTTRNHLEVFDLKRGKRAKVVDVDQDFYDEFIKYFHDKNASINTIGTHIKNVKVFLSDAESRGLTVSPDYRKKRFKVVEEQSDTIYLTTKEIKRISKVDLSKTPYLDRIRDLFLLGCFTGLRFSDYSQVIKSHLQIVNGGQVLRIKMTKTGENVVIPVGVDLQRVLKKYDYELPRVPSNQKMNEYIKVIGKEAKINDIVSISLSKGAMRVEEDKEKYNLISTHTARRSFATNAYLAGVPTISLMKITGHKTEKSFLKYIRISQEDNAVKLIQHPFFKGQLGIV